MMKKRGLFLLAAVFCISLCACGGNEKAVKPTNAPTPTEVVEPTTTPTVTFEPTSTPVPTETVEPTTTPTPTETPVANEDREVVDYYIDPHTGQKVAVTATPTPEPTPEASEKMTLYGEIFEVTINKGILTLNIHVACPHGDNGMCYAGTYLIYKVVDVEANAENEKLYSKGSIVQVILEKIPGKCSAVTHFLTLDNVKVVK